MDALQAVIYGLVQGLTEFLPISSSAHLRITAGIAGWDDPGAAFTAVIQIGTELAVLLYFRHDIARILVAWWRSLPAVLARRGWPADTDARMGWLIIIGTIPIGLLGILLQDTIKTAFRDLHLIAATLIVFGLLLGWADRVATNRRTLEDLTPRHGLLYGFAQALALVPGVSRSGGTITAGLLLGYRREAAARYAFLLAVPAVLASGLYELKDIGGEHVSWGPTILATVISFLVGFAVVAWLMRFISTHSFRPFVIYRVALGILLLILIAAGAVDPNAASSI
ncbi:undecaprenyl-diphosphate phosphatase [Patulibacter brassicae]|jgi:undecaprenyl-diphosphatase|uniref:Undecaprenyl-diphosphatase n=1 Tax=Patulibacter brassicae TaxID=1705717 RepID=A0ABU4VL37_9ACTN|nr:undecaprenyl-diphosphate phosphatase [Patulibacter brassicae]MDX8151578.1 undecaprenyl-diphosphate phosphatase [Patulibacter brassicae]